MWPFPPPPPQPPRPDATPLYARKPKEPEKPPSLEEQFESLLDQVWDSERRERMNDRIDAALAREPLKPRRRRKKRDG